MPAALYMVVLGDSASDNYEFGVYKDTGKVNKVYTSLEAAKSVLVATAAKFEEFLPTAYGKAFPYDTVTFEVQLEKEHYAPWGWGVVHSEEGVMRVSVGLLALTIE